MTPHSGTAFDQCPDWKCDCGLMQPKFPCVICGTWSAMNRTPLLCNECFPIHHKNLTVPKPADYAHGSSLHSKAKEAGFQFGHCVECIEEKRNWLDTNAPDWKELTKEKGCCNLCIERAYSALYKESK